MISININAMMCDMSLINIFNYMYTFSEFVEIIIGKKDSPNLARNMMNKLLKELYILQNR